jgi:hypothetical protein
MFVQSSILWRKVWCSKELVQSVCNCCLICFNKYQVYRYLCADRNVVILKFINVLDLCRLMGLCLFCHLLVRERQVCVCVCVCAYIYVYIIQEQTIKF